MGEAGLYHSVVVHGEDGTTRNFLTYPLNTQSRFIVRLSGTYYLSIGKDENILANPTCEKSFPYTFEWNENHEIAKIFTKDEITKFC